MTSQTPLIPRQPVPDIAVPLAGGGAFRLSEERPQNFTMAVVYRGLHCPICKGYLSDLQSKLDAFDKLGVGVVALSSDDKARGEQAKTDWGLDRLRLGYGLSVADGRALGLYVSSGRGTTSAGIEEPALFVEPGLFVIKPDQTLYFASVQTMPFARPAFGDILKAMEFVIAKGYPARGEVIGLPAA